MTEAPFGFVRALARLPARGFLALIRLYQRTLSPTLPALLGPASLGVLATYLGLTFLYTFYLKRKLLVDVFSLAILYTLRIVEGGAD